MNKIIVDGDLLIKKIQKKSGPIYQIVQQCLAGRYQPIFSEKTLKECVRSLGYSDMAPEYQETLEDFFAVSDIIKADFELNEVKKDPASNKFIECALASQADWLITENKHLLALQKYLRTEIIKPADFLKIKK